MKRLNIKRILCLLVVLCMLASASLNLTGCSQDGVRLISYSLDKDASNLDPQTATESGDMMVIGNTMEGLYRKAGENSYVLGAAKNLEKSADGLTLTFDLHEGIKWKYYESSNKMSDGTVINEKVTAHDFVFAFQRLFTPSLKTKFAQNYFFIKNAQEIKSGELPMSALGLKAEGDYRLVMTLEHEDPLIERLLTEPPAMPCNKMFFEKSQGSYGMSGTMLLANGPFYVKAWSNSENGHYVRVRKNENYSDSSRIEITGGNFTVRTQAESAEKFKKKDINTAIVNQRQYDDLDVESSRSKSFQSTVTGIGFNSSSELLSNENIRKALAMAIDRNVIKEKLSSGQTLANSVVPPSITIGKDSYRSKVESNIALEYNEEQAQNLLEIGLKELNEQKSSLNKISILVSEEMSTEVIEQILQTWQKILGVYFKPNIQKKSDYDKLIASKKYECAMINVSSDADYPGDLLSKFSAKLSGGTSPNSINNYDEILSNAVQSVSSEKMSQTYLEAEKTLINSGLFIPLIYPTEYFVYKKGVENFIFEPGGRKLFLI